MRKSFKEPWRWWGVSQQRITSRLLVESSIGSRGYIANVRRFLRKWIRFLINL
nr:unknown protein [Arabidopsis thaliana]AAM47919.1 unknown protein [Arabidopsis thaliana]